MGKLRHGDGDWDGEAREFDSGEHTLRLLVTVRFNTAETCRLINRVTAGPASRSSNSLVRYTCTLARLAGFNCGKIEADVPVHRVNVVVVYGTESDVGG